MDDIEEYYSREIERIDQEFLKGVGQNVNRKELEKKYREQLKLIIQTYQEKTKKSLPTKFEKLNKKLLKKFEKQKIKPFKAEIPDAKLTWKEKQKIKYEIFKFKTKRKLRRFFFKIIPEKIIYFYFKVKIEAKAFKINLFNFADRKITQIKETSISFFEKIKEKTLKVIKKLKEIYLKMLKKSKKGSNGKESEKKDSEESNKKSPNTKSQSSPS